MSEKEIYIRDNVPKKTGSLLLFFGALVIIGLLYTAAQPHTGTKQNSANESYPASEATQTAGLPTAGGPSITVIFQGEKVRVAAGATPQELLSKNSTDTLQYYGDLLDVSGEVIEVGRGGDPAFIISGAPYKEGIPLFAGDTISVERGSNITEETVTIRNDVRPGYKRTGGGAIPTLLTPGRSGVTEKTVGKLSGKVASEIIITKPVKASMDYRQYRDSDDKVIALTFDDGPHQKDTQAIVNALRDGGVKATFFMLAKNVKKEPALARMVSDAGNEVGIHSNSHQLMTKQSDKEIKKEITRSADAILKATGQSPRWIRPPYGAVDGLVYTTLAQQNLHIALWSVDTYDWKKPGVSAIVKRAKKGYPGAIILMHDGGGNRDQTAAALPKIIKYFKKAGYRFVTLSEYQALIDGAEKK